MDVWGTDVMVTLWSVLGALLATLLLLAGTLWASAALGGQVRRIWRALRGHVPQVIAAVDQPGDAINVHLARLTQLPPGVWSAFLTAFVEALAAGLDQAAAQVDPVGEQPGD